jgi:hypothetical protein
MKVNYTYRLNFGYLKTKITKNRKKKAPENTGIVNDESIVFEFVYISISTRVREDILTA